MQDPTPGRIISRRDRRLNREEQARAFQELQQQYGSGAAPPPPPPVAFRPFKETAPPPKQALTQLESRMKEYSFVEQVEKVREEIKEAETKETISQFYCAHDYVRVNSTFYGLPIKARLCKKCGLTRCGCEQLAYPLRQPPDRSPSECHLKSFSALCLRVRAARSCAL